MDFELLEGYGMGTQVFSPLWMLVSFGAAVLLVSFVLKLVLRRLRIGRPKGRPLEALDDATAGLATDSDEVEQGALSRVYRVAPGLKFVTLFGAVALLWIIRPDLPGEVARGVGQVPGFLRVPGLALSGPNAWYIFCALAFAAFLYVHYIWTYRIELNATEITYSRLGFSQCTHDLRKLDRIEDGGPYGLRLYFEDGRKGDVMKQVRGMQDMMNRLRAHLV